MSGKTNNKSIYLMIAILLAGLTITSLNNSLINVALPKLIIEFKITAATAQWLSTGYLLVTAIFVPISTFLVQKFSYKQLFAAAMGIFTIGSFVCGLSDNFSVMMVGRVLQASSSGVLMPLAINIITNAFPIEKRGSAMGILGVGMVLAPAIGPTLAGWFIEYYRWNGLFFAFAAIGVAVLISAVLLFKFENERRNAKLDILGTILSSIGFGSLLYGVSKIAAKGLEDTEVIILLLISAIFLTIFVIHSLHKDSPLLKVRVFKDFNFTFTTIMYCVMQAALYGALILLPIYLQTVRGYSALDSGIVLLPGSLVLGLMGVVTGKLYDKFGIKPLAIIGISIMTIATYMFSNLSVDTPFSFIIILYAIRGLGMSFVIMPIMTASNINMSRENIPHSTALFNTLGTVSSSIGGAVLIAVMTNSSKSYLKGLGEVTSEGMKLATLHGINKAFLVSTALGVLAFVLAFFLKKKRSVVKI